MNKVGHTIVVYERNNRMGGLLRYGIPTMKLEKEVVQRRIDLLEAEGVKFIPNMEIGKDVPATLLTQENDAVLVCTGATKPRDLPIPGAIFHSSPCSCVIVEGNVLQDAISREFTLPWNSWRRGRRIRAATPSTGSPSTPRDARLSCSAAVTRLLTASEHHSDTLVTYSVSFIVNILYWVKRNGKVTP